MEEKEAARVMGESHGAATTQGKKEEGPHKQGREATPPQLNSLDIRMSRKLQEKKTTRGREKTGTEIDPVVT